MSGIEVVSLHLNNLMKEMVETASKVIEGFLLGNALDKSALIIFQIICFIGISLPSCQITTSNSL